MEGKCKCTIMEDHRPLNPEGGFIKKPKETTIHVLLPHELLHCFWQAATPFVFSSVMLGNLNSSARTSFFEHLKSLGPWKNHPVLNAQRDFSKLIPITIHGDGAQFYREDEFFCWSWASAFGFKGLIKDPMLFKYPICIIPERCMRERSELRLSFECTFSLHP